MNSKQIPSTRAQHHPNGGHAYSKAGTTAETLEVLFQDEHLVAVHKPSGLLVHRSPIDKRETRFALQLVRDQVGQHVFPMHRLDKPTSGILLFALSSEVANTMMEQYLECLSCRARL